MHRHHPPAPAPSGYTTARTARLGATLSLVSAAIAILLRSLTDVSEPTIVVGVMLVAFGLSWHATWQDL